MHYTYTDLYHFAQHHLGPNVHHKMKNTAVVDLLAIQKFKEIYALIINCKKIGYV